MKSKPDSEDEQRLTDDRSVTSTSLSIDSQGILRVCEPPVTPIPSNFAIASSDYKWNKIVEVQLFDGEMVWIVCNKMKLFNLNRN